MRVVIQKVDLDTCVAAYVLGIGDTDEIIVEPLGAAAAELEDPRTICLEAGGSGSIALNNYDHHDPAGPTEAACRQALRASGRRDPWLNRLVAYAEGIDLGTRSGDRIPPAPHSLTLSGLVSGVRLVRSGERERLLAVLDVLHTVESQGWDPFDPLPRLSEWEPYVRARERAAQVVERAAAGAEYFVTSQGLRAGFIRVSAPGALHLLYAQGCDVAIAYSPNGVGSDERRLARFTIGGREGRRVDQLLTPLNELEPGWGGPSHGTIIGSPRSGTTLTPDQVKAIVETGC